MSMDMTDSIVPKSDQMNAEDLLTGPRTFTIAEVRKSGSGEQPVEVVLKEFPHDRPFKPSKTVRRIMVAAWGPDAANYKGRRMTLYRDPSVKWAGQDVGGIRVSHMSHIDKRLTVALTVTRGKRAPYVVEPLGDAPTKSAESLDVPADAPSGPTSTAKATAKQVARIGMLATDLGLDRDAKLAGVAATIGHEVATTKDLTPQEASDCIDSMQASLDARAAK